MASPPPHASRTDVPAAVRARLRAVRLRARDAAANTRYGQHASRARGSGIEFAQYRAYEPGDDPRRIDWKLLARSDRVFVREAEREAALRVWILIDTSASMRQEDAANPGWCRLDAACALATCVIGIAERQGDAFGCIGIGGAGIESTPMGAGRGHRARCLLALQRLQASGEWPPPDRLQELWKLARPHDRLLVIGDHFDEGCIELIESLARSRREVSSIFVSTREERDFPFEGGYRFVDPESGSSIVADSRAARTAFVASFAAARSALGMRLAASGVRNVEYFMDRPLDEPLRLLLEPRRGVR